MSQAKESIRFVPFKPTEGLCGDLVLAGKKEAAEAMKARKPTADAARNAEDAASVVWNSRNNYTPGESLKRHRSK